VVTLIRSYLRLRVSPPNRHSIISKSVLTETPSCKSLIICETVNPACSPITASFATAVNRSGESCPFEHGTDTSHSDEARLKNSTPLHAQSQRILNVTECIYWLPLLYLTYCREVNGNGYWREINLGAHSVRVTHKPDRTMSQSVLSLAEKSHTDRSARGESPLVAAGERFREWN
jgi:hypothetical protein